VLFSDGVGGWRCRRYRLLFPQSMGFMFYVKVIVSGGKRYFYIRAG
jgi:hypothetical protein